MTSQAHEKTPITWVPENTEQALRNIGTENVPATNIKCETMQQISKRKSQLAGTIDVNLPLCLLLSDTFEIINSLSLQAIIMKGTFDLLMNLQ